MKHPNYLFLTAIAAVFAAGVAVAGPTVYVPLGSGNRVFVSNSGSGTFSEIDVASRKEPKIWVVDQNTLQVPGEIALPAGEARQMAVVK